MNYLDRSYDVQTTNRFKGTVGLYADTLDNITNDDAVILSYLVERQIYKFMKAVYDENYKLPCDK